MGGQRAEIVAQAITGEDGQAARGQPVAQVVDQGVGGRLRARPEVEDGDDLGDGISGHPQPQDRALVTQART
jgi:hypothetical protein